MWFGSPGFDANFWPSFWGNLFADVIVATVVVALLNRLDYFLKRPNAKIELIWKSVNDMGDIEFDIWIHNTGKLSFGPDEMYWHLLFDPNTAVLWDTLEVSEIVTAGRSLPLRFSVRRGPLWEHLQGILKGGIFPETGYHVASIKVRPDPNTMHSARCFFNTTHGRIPKLFWLKKLLFGFQQWMHITDDPPGTWAEIDIARAIEQANETRSHKGARF